MEGVATKEEKVLTKRGRGRKRRNLRNKLRRNGQTDLALSLGQGDDSIDLDANHYVYLIIGSQDSTDLDTLYVFDRLPSTQLCYKFCDFASSTDQLHEEDHEEEEEQGHHTTEASVGDEVERSLTHLQRQLRHKPENKNIIVLDENGIVCDCFKGIPDAIQNCVYYTYSLHEQDHPSPVAHRLVHRNVPLRWVKATRDLMGLLSKTKYRQLAKAALKAADTFTARRECLLQVDFREVKDELSASQFKTVAFHFAQLIGLASGREFFTKADLAAAFPDLKPFLYRAEDATANLEVLNQYRDAFTTLMASTAVVTRGSLLLFYADPALCDGHFNMLNYASRGLIVDCIREQCLAYPLEHYFAVATPGWPTDEDLLRQEDIGRVVTTTTTTMKPSSSSPGEDNDDGDAERLAFFTAFVDPKTRRPSLAGERGFDVPPSVARRWDDLIAANTATHATTTVGSEDDLLQVLRRYTLVFAARDSPSADEQSFDLFGARHRFTNDLQPYAVVQEIARRTNLPLFAR